MVFTKDGKYIELTDPAHIDAFKAAGWGPVETAKVEDPKPKKRTARKPSAKG